MARDGPTTLTQDLTQREGDRQRWADDGGPSPDQLSVPPIIMPVRLVYLRPDGAEPSTFSPVLHCASIPTP